MSHRLAIAITPCMRQEDGGRHALSGMAPKLRRQAARRLRAKVSVEGDALSHLVAGVVKVEDRLPSRFAVWCWFE
ncbi:MAG: hypothetical protein IJI68_01940 [Eggerthellaceae bacterium]|nr:hypothetical protein [Eggerthellaceae bacterium]